MSVHGRHETNEPLVLAQILERHLHREFQSHVVQLIVEGKDERLYVVCREISVSGNC